MFAFVKLDWFLFEHKLFYGGFSGGLGSRALRGLFTRWRQFRATLHWTLLSQFKFTLNIPTLLFEVAHLGDKCFALPADQLWKAISLTYSNSTDKMNFCRKVFSTPLLPKTRSMWRLSYAPPQSRQTEFRGCSFLGVGGSIQEIFNTENVFDLPDAIAH